MWSKKRLMVGGLEQFEKLYHGFENRKDHNHGQETPVMKLAKVTPGSWCAICHDGRFRRIKRGALKLAQNSSRPVELETSIWHLLMKSKIEIKAGRGGDGGCSLASGKIVHCQRQSTGGNGGRSGSVIRAVRSMHRARYAHPESLCRRNGFPGDSKRSKTSGRGEVKILLLNFLCQGVFDKSSNWWTIYARTWGQEFYCYKAVEAVWGNERAF